MGEAKRKKEMAAALPPTIPVIDRDKFIQALGMVIQAITDFSGADCTLYAMIGAEALKAKGFAAVPAAGSAAWRVGRGDGDMISHAPEAIGQIFVPAGAVKAGMFHAWIEARHGADVFVIDATTAQLRQKAASLDELDGGTTSVEFSPDYLWISLRDATRMSFSAVTQSFDAGVYAYLRKPEIEPVVFSAESKENLDSYVFATLQCYEMLCQNQTVQVVGLGEDGPTLPDQPSYKPASRKFSP